MKERAKESENEEIKIIENVKGVDFGPGTEHHHAIDPETGSSEAATGSSDSEAAHDEL